MQLLDIWYLGSIYRGVSRNQFSGGSAGLESYHPVPFVSEVLPSLSLMLVGQNTIHIFILYLEAFLHLCLIFM